jgi:ribokinase
MPDVIVIGSLNMDLVVKTSRMPSGGETLLGETFHTIPGGKGANQALAIAKMGGRVAMIGRVGIDGFGERLRHNLEAGGVDVTHLKSDGSAPTGVALIVVEPAGENRIIVVSGANFALTAEDILEIEPFLKQARMLVVQFEVPMEVVEAAVRLADRHSIPIIVNAAPAHPIVPDLFPLIDYLVVNENEAGLLSGVKVIDIESGRQAARVLQDRGAKHVILTLGPQGALGRTSSEEFHVPAVSVNAVDTTAAGDGFIGGLVVSLLDESGSFCENIRCANAAGAITATRFGAQSSLPSRAEVETFLENSGRV